MAGILESYASMLSPDLIKKVGSTFGIDSSHVTRGLSVIGPVALGALAKNAASPGGAISLFSALPQDTGGGNWLSSITSLLGGGSDATHAHADAADSVFGAGTNAVGAWLTEKLGFNVRPLIGLAAPMVLGIVSKHVQSQGLNATGLADWLRNENDTFMKNPENKETAGIVFSALAASDKANALRQMYDEAEWTKVRSAPLAALYHLAAASQAGASGLAKEFTAASDAFAEATQRAPGISLIGTAFGSGLLQEKWAQLTKDRPTSTTLLRDLHESVTIVARKSPTEAQAYREAVLGAAQRAAEATKEGGFLGIGGTKVSEAEQRALDDIRTALT
jgi:Bacterial protein of unknown function (DUF937)